MHAHPLIQYLHAPANALTFQVRDWERLIRAARHGNLLSRVAWLAMDQGLIRQFPERVQFHLESAFRVSESQAISVKFEVHQIQKNLATSNIPFVLLKGAAYIQAGLAPAPGRLMSDIDLMVPRNRLEDAERALCANGWFPTKLDAYDQRYYREWMHELPPLQHLGRGTSLDVHHTILPPTALLKPDVELLWKSAQAVDAMPGVYVLSPIDMVLHSATHLFHDGELEHGLRDLVDMDALIRQFSHQSLFFDSLVDRAFELDLSRPLHYALRYCQLFLQTRIPANVMARMEGAANRSAVVRTVMSSVIPQCVGSVLQEEASFRTHASQYAMYVRSHYLRMPMRLLLPHLLRKAWMGWFPEKPAANKG